MPSTQPADAESPSAGQPVQFVAGHPISPATLATMAAAHQLQLQQVKGITPAAAGASAADASTMEDTPAEAKVVVKAESPLIASAAGVEVPLMLSPTHHIKMEAAAASMMDTTTTATAATALFSPAHAMPVVAAAIPLMMAPGSTPHHATVAGGHRAMLLHQQQQAHLYQQQMAHDSEDDSDEDEDHPHLAQQYRPTTATAAGVRVKKSKSARVSCHQCKTTKEDGLLLFCTTKAEKGLRKRKCRKKYVSLTQVWQSGYRRYIADLFLSVFSVSV